MANPPALNIDPERAGCRTIVRSVSGRAELRGVAEVKEWRIEPELDSGGMVISFTTGTGAIQSFLVADFDALDIANVLQRHGPAG